MSGEQYREAAQELVGTRKAANAFSAAGVDAVAPDAGVFKIGSDGSAGGALRQAYSIAVGMGNLDAGQVSVSLAGTAASQSQRDQEEREKKSKRDYEEQMFQNMLQRAQDWSDRLGRDIDGMEAEFTREYGDAWREHIANEVLDPDIIPQRRDGESLAAYRERLEAAIQDEMLNEDGSIKDEYKTGPYARYAQWAHTEDQKRKADDELAVIHDPNASPDQQRAAAGRLSQQLDEAGLYNAAGRLEDREVAANVIVQEADERRDAQSVRVAASAPISSDFG